MTTPPGHDVYADYLSALAELDELPGRRESELAAIESTYRQEQAAAQLHRRSVDDRTRALADRLPRLVGEARRLRHAAGLDGPVPEAPCPARSLDEVDRELRRVDTALRAAAQAWSWVEKARGPVAAAPVPRPHLPPVSPTGPPTADASTRPDGASTSRLLVAAAAGVGLVLAAMLAVLVVVLA